MSRAFLFLVLALLCADASGVTALVSPESCSVLEDSLPDGKCPPLCVRCSCSAQPVVPQVDPGCSGEQVVTTAVFRYLPALSAASPHDILHVPK